MSDLISREDAIKIADKECEEYRGIFTRIVYRLNELELVDAEPVRHGKWIPHKEISREYIGTVMVCVRYDYWFCNNCGYRVENGQPIYDYCPKCGARMDEVREDDTRKL